MADLNCRTSCAFSGLPVADLGEDGLDLAVGVVLGVGGLQAVVGEPAAVLVEEGVPLAQGLDVLGEVGDLHVAQLFELVDEDVDLLARSSTAMAWSGRHAVWTLISKPSCRIFWWCSSVSSGPSVVQTSLTFIFRMMLRTLNSGERSISLHSW